MKEYNKNQPETIQAMFGSIAKNYDRTNAVLSFQMHRLWNSKLVHHILAKDNPKTFVDLCCGTGEIAFGWLKKTNEKRQAYLVDFCPEMLQCAQMRGKELNIIGLHAISFVQADVQKLPLDAASVESATVAYGIRNVKDPLQCFREVFRVLKPGGRFGILELTEPKNPVLKFGHRVYLRTVLPVIGKLLTSNQDAYKYLCNSIHNFVKPTDVAQLLHKSGFQDVEILPLTGGIATIISAKKPIK